VDHPAEEEHDEVQQDWSRDEWWRHRFQMYEDNFS
jgi:hypothetical protein